MNASSNPICPHCQQPLPANAPGGLCPNCLLAMNLRSETLLSGEESPDSPLPAEVLAPHFPQLEILEFLGRGGMGVVYKARQVSLNRMVALKILAPERTHDSAFAARFAREAQALAALSHPHIVTIHDFGQTGEYYYLIMELVDGVNLRQLLKAKKLTPEEALAIVPDLCAALQYAHEHGIVHRDIKPENLLLDRAGQIKIADFGIAKMLGEPAGETPSGEAETQTQHALGTRGYVAPEQRTQPSRVDARADIYSLGVVFYEMLTGELPPADFEPPSKRAKVDARLDEVVKKALAASPDQRYQTAEELRTLLTTLTLSLEQSGSGRWKVRGIRWLTFAAILWPFLHFPFNCSSRLSTYPGILLAVCILVWGLRHRRQMPAFQAIVGSLAALLIWWLAAVDRGGGLTLMLAGENAVSIETLINEPYALKVCSTPKVIEVGLADTNTPWAWQELRERKLTTEDAAAIMAGLTEWLRRDHPNGYREPLHWIDRVFTLFTEKAMLSNRQRTDFVIALAGNPVTSPIHRIYRKIESLDVELELESHFNNDVLRTSILSELESVTLDDQPVPYNVTNYLFGDRELRVNIQLPPLATGKHHLQYQLVSRIFDKEDLLGITKHIPSNEWPAGLAEWRRTAETELDVHDEQPIRLVTSATDANTAERDPFTHGTQIKRVVIRREGTGLTAFLEVDRYKPPICLACDVTLVIGGQEIPCFPYWISPKDDGGITYSSEDVKSKNNFDALPADVVEADIRLTPNPNLVKDCYWVNEIWGEETVLKHVPIKRLDLGTATTNIEPPQQPAKLRPVEPIEPVIVDVSAHQGESWTAKLPQGEIELVAIARHPSKGESWWRPDGSPYEKGSFEPFGARLSPSADQRAFNFIICSRGLPEGSSVPKWNLPLSRGVGTLSAREPIGELDSGDNSFCATYPSSLRSANIRMGIAIDSWKTIHESEGSAGSIECQVDGTDWKIIYAAPLEKKDGSLVISGTYSPSDQDTRIVLVDRQGTEHTAAARSYIGTGSLNHGTTTFEHVKAEEIKAVKFQARPYRWVEFRNVALEPQAGAEVKTEDVPNQSD